MGIKLLSHYLRAEWIGRGRYFIGLTWLKLIYWHHDPTLTPVQVIWKAYDSMPTIERPDFDPSAPAPG